MMIEMLPPLSDSTVLKTIGLAVGQPKLPSLLNGLTDSGRGVGA
jgi:hypothetical protein